ncbi:MAG: sigma-54-dependent Fis family transcriptional regulator [Thauera sp.]|nr:sigma-54-dependent Fis family transcriptional regulator [Thauera sp.]
MEGRSVVREAHETRVRAARQHFFERGDDAAPGLAPVVLRSWSRCAARGIDMGATVDRDPAGRAQLADMRERSNELLHQAGGIMEHVFEQIRASGSMVILADADGVILHSLGDPDFVGRAQRVALQPGATWGEAVRGTNAIGTALVERQPVEVCGGEHFLDRNGFLTCSASPVFDAHGRLAGALDISSDYRNHQPHTLGLVRLSVQLLEKRLFEHSFAHDIVLAFHPRPEYVGSMQEGLIALSADGQVLGMNAAARECLGSLAADAHERTLDSLFRMAFGNLIDRAGRDPASLLAAELRNGQQVYLRIRAGAPLRYGRMVASASGRSMRAEKAPTLDDLATGDAQLQLALDRGARILGKDIPLLIQGESGVGKELFARAFHHSGPRRDGPFVALNCAAIPENLIESELFGYSGGAFTGARREGAVGKIQQAHGGTLFLDEIGDMPLGMQARLLRVLQERSVTPVGGSAQVAVDISLVCATHRTLRELVREGGFREDLYYRVNGLTVTLPALRERSDIRRIVMSLLACEAGGEGEREIGISEEVMSFFERYPWPGNVRQLQNVIRVAVALLDEDEALIQPRHLPEDLFGTDEFDGAKGVADDTQREASWPAAGGHGVPATASLDEIELQAISRAMRDTGGNVSAAARRLGISRNTLYRKLGRMS